MPSLNWRCVNRTGFVSEAIDFVSRGAVCHVEFIFPDGTSIGAHSAGGVQVRKIDAYPVDYRFSADCTDEQYDAAIAFLKAQIGKPYDFVDIGAIIADRNWRDPNRWICSELWAATLEAGKIIKPLPSSVNLVTPQDALLISSAMLGLAA